jgi:hypothetical protein
MPANPEHFWTQPLGDRFRHDGGSWEVVETRHFLNSTDYTNVYCEWQQQSIDSNNVDCYFEVDDGVNPAVNSGTFTTALLTWQDSTLRTIDISGLTNTMCALKVYMRGNGRIRGPVGLLS